MGGRSIFAEGFSTDPWWWRDAPPVAYPEPPPSSADVVVVGAGYAGLAAATELAGAGRSTVLLDMRRVGEGASGCNAGLVSGRQGISKMIDLVAYVGEERAAARGSNDTLRCCVSGCGLEDDGTDDVSFHPLVQQNRPELRAWLRVIGRGLDWRPRGAMDRLVCSRHFNEQDFKEGERVLRDGVAPKKVNGELEESFFDCSAFLEALHPPIFAILAYL